MKILVEKAVIAQALEALGSYKQPIYSHAPIDAAITALREALEVTEASISDHKSEPVVKKSLTTETIDGLSEQAEYTLHTSDKPLHHFALVLRDLDKTVDGWCEEPEFYLDGERLYAAPVRTKDLTDDEISEVVFSIVKDTPTNYERTLCRAVIAKDREKNR